MDVFICYAHADRDTVVPRVGALEAHGITCWRDPQIAAGSAWREVIGAAIESCDALLVFLSPRSAAPPTAARQSPLPPTAASPSSASVSNPQS